MDRMRKNYKKKELIKIALLITGSHPCLLRIITQGLTGCYGISACCSSHVYGHSGLKKEEKGIKIDWKRDR